jgi:NADPH-dependent 2,4-dienoyl-CoA reductase/sulfur reductase-like enzyme
VSRDMSPGMSEEGSSHKAEENGILGFGDTNGRGRDDRVNHVTVVGAGPAGLMLAYAISKAL